MNNGSLNLFISYAHRDEVYRRNLSAHLAPLRHLGLISEWTDRLLIAGTDWGKDIESNINQADIIILLVSSDFINSSYCYGIEMEMALARHNAGIAKVIPVIAREAYWEPLPFGKIQALPAGAKPISVWRDKDSAYLSVVQGIENVARKMLIDSTPTIVSEWATSLLYRRKVVRIVQSFLKNQNLYIGPIDGEPANIHLRESVRLFQKKTNLFPDGLIGPETLKAIVLFENKS